MNFRVGQKVVCIEAFTRKPGFGYGDEIMPVKGAVYTVRDIDSTRCDGKCGLRLVEIVNPPRLYEQGHHEIWYLAARFRPVVERKTDISVFTKILDDVRAPMAVD